MDGPHGSANRGCGVRQNHCQSDRLRAHQSGSWQEVSMSNLLPKSRIVRIEVSISLPISATLDQVEEWAGFELGRGAMAVDNPLGNYDLEAINDPILTDTQSHLHS